MIVQYPRMKGSVMRPMERTFLMIKPDGVQRGLIGRIVGRLEDKGFKLVAGKFLQISDEQAKRHYAEHEGKDFLKIWLDL